MTSKLDEQLLSIKEKIAEAQEAEKKILQRKKEEARVKEVYPDAEYAVLPDGSSGFVTLQIHLQTPGIRRRFFMDRDRKLSCFVGLDLKIGKREVFIANPTSGYTNPKEVFDFANRWEAEQIKKRSKKNNEVEVVPKLK